jgi:hypothetical protein
MPTVTKDLIPGAPQLARGTLQPRGGVPSDPSSGFAVGEPTSRGRHLESAPPSTNTRAAALATRTYWAAGAAAFRIQSLAREAVTPQERAALAKLRAVEEQRREIARQMLLEVWHTHIDKPESPEARPTPWPVADHLH